MICEYIFKTYYNCDSFLHFLLIGIYNFDIILWLWQLKKRSILELFGCSENVFDILAHGIQSMGMDRLHYRNPY